MTLKAKLAQRLRRWADRLNPYFKYDNDISSIQFNTSQHDIQRLSIQVKYSAYAYAQYGEHIDKYIKKEIADKIAQALCAQNFIAITFHRDPSEVTYTGEIKVVCPHE